MIHRAPFGSMERFIGVLIEHFAGAFPFWLAPVQVAVLTISEKFNDYANKVASLLQQAGLRVESNLSGKKSAAKSAPPRWIKSPTCSSSAKRNRRRIKSRCESHRRGQRGDHRRGIHRKAEGRDQLAAVELLWNRAMISIRRINPDDADLLRTIRLRALSDTPIAFGSTYAREVAFPEQEWQSRAGAKAPAATQHVFSLSTVRHAAGSLRASANLKFPARHASSRCGLHPKFVAVVLRRG